MMQMFGLVEGVVIVLFVLLFDVDVFVQVVEVNDWMSCFFDYFDLYIFIELNCQFYFVLFELCFNLYLFDFVYCGWVWLFGICDIMFVYVFG